MASNKLTIRFERLGWYRGVDVFMMRPGSVFLFFLGTAVRSSSSFDEVSNEIDAWWKLRAN